MPNKYLKFEIISTIFIMILGTILHFTYDFSKQNIVVGIFSAVNESVWEHLKLLFFPSLITIIWGYLKFWHNYTNYICVKVKGLILGMLFLVIFYYSYTGIIGKDIPILNIGSFFAAVLISTFYSIKKINLKNNCNKLIPWGILMIIVLSFGFFTFCPPKINLFKDPITNTFGITK